MKCCSVRFQAILFTALIILLTTATLYWAKIVLNENIEYLHTVDKIDAPVKM
jgi:hypothetical protein